MVLFLLLLLPFTAFAETPSYESDDSIAWMQKPLPDRVQNFCQIDGNIESIFPSRLLDSELSFTEGDLNFSYTRMFSAERALAVGVGYTRTRFEWANNSFFTEGDFDTLNFSLNGIAKPFTCLELKGGVAASFQTKEWASDYSFYTFAIWGRYEWNSSVCPIGLNLGVTDQVGLKKSIFYPIIGVDFNWSKDVEVNLIFPIDMAIVYHITDCWSWEIGGKLWDTRRRLAENDPLSAGFFEYKNAGVALGLNFSYDPVLFLNIHVGTTLGTGEMTLSDAQAHEITTLKVKPALYIGGEFWLRF